MRYLPKGEGSGSILDEGGAVVAQVTLAPGVSAETLLRALAPRVAIWLREGLIERLEADTPCGVLAIEEDRYAQPPLRARRFELEGDPEALESLWAQAPPEEPV